MKRRLVLTAGALVAALSFSSCSTFDHSDVAATVNGHELTRDQLDAMLPTETDPESVRTALTIWARLVILEGENYSGVPESADSANARLLGMVSDIGEAYYNEGSATTGLVCVSAIVTTEESSALEAAAAITDGAAFAEVFPLYNESASLQPTGGVVTDSATGADCLPIDGFDPELTAAFSALTIGQPSEPIPFAGGFVLAYPRPWAEVSEASQATFISAAGGPTGDGAEVSIASRFGSWNPTTGSVEPTAAG